MGWLRQGWARDGDRLWSADWPMLEQSNSLASRLFIVSGVRVPSRREKAVSRTLFVSKKQADEPIL
jgi:hypothetical protein